MIDGYVTGDAEVAARFRQASDKMSLEVYKAVYELSRDLVRDIQNKKLAGQVLKRKSGRLSRSVHEAVTREESKSVGVVSTNVEYAPIHEFGGTINHPGGTAYFFDPKAGALRFIPNASPFAAHAPRTKPHQITMPERSFMRSALRDMESSGAIERRFALAAERATQ